MADGKSQYRSLVFNLKDEKNSAFRQAILRRELSAVTVAGMNSTEMANPDIQKEKLAVETKHLDRINSSNHKRQGNRTTMLTCGKCKQSDCIYYEMQTASGDEPSTKFVTCNVCGNNWKFR